MVQHMMHLFVIATTAAAAAAVGPDYRVPRSSDGCQWGARPCWVDPAADCTFRHLAMDFAGTRLNATFGWRALQGVAAALQLGPLCNGTADPQTRSHISSVDVVDQHRSFTEPHSNSQSKNDNTGPCRFEAAGTGRVFAVAGSTTPGGGSDAGPGTLASPFATLSRAVHASRDRGSPPAAGATIVLLSGAHYLSATIELGPADSGLVITGCDGEFPILSSGVPLQGRWETTPGNPEVSMMRNASGGAGAIDGLFLSSDTGGAGAFNTRLVRARHPNSNPERVQWPSSEPSGGSKQYGADMYVGPDDLFYPSDWMAPPAWQLVPPTLHQVDTPNWNTEGGLPPSVEFTSAGGMSPYYQARVGGPMDRFVGGVNPGPTRTNCLLTAVGKGAYPAGCAVPGGVYFTPHAFDGAAPPASWEHPETGVVHAVHPLGCPVMPTAVPWFNWQWRLAGVQHRNATPSPTPPHSTCGLKQTLQGGCCGGQNVGAAHQLPTFNTSACVELCCSDPLCGVAVLTSNQSGDGVVRCWLTHLDHPDKLEPSPPTEKAVTLVTRGGNATPPGDALLFGEGGWQALQGSPVGSHFFVENIRELLDSEGEWFHDNDTDTLYLWRNATQEAEAPPSSQYVGSRLESAVRIVGLPPHPARAIRLDGIAFRHTTTDYLAPHEGPGGGDQAVHRGGAVLIEGAANVTVQRCEFDRVDGSGVFVSRWARDVAILECEFGFTGSAGVVVMGEAEWMDGTAGRFPRRTVIRNNWLHDGGVWSKNYLGGSVFLALQSETVVEGNVIYNTPRSALTFNDGFGGGDNVTMNLLFNANRESADTGVVYTYNRLPFLTTVRNGTPSLIPAARAVERNLLIANYGTGACLDNDDGSSFFDNRRNVNVYCPAKHSTFLNGAHAKNNSESIYYVNGPCDYSGGYDEVFDANHCFTTSTASPTSRVPCDPAHPTSTPGHPTTTPARRGNIYHVPNPSQFTVACGAAGWNLSTSQSKGYEVGSVVLPLGGAAAGAATAVGLARELLGMA